MTNRELAGKLGVSPSTLSMILNRKPGISEAKRASVLEQLEEMGLEHLIREPEAAADSRNPPKVQGGQICFLIYRRTGEILNQHPFFMLLMESIEERARSYGCSVMLMTVTRESVADQLRLLKKMKILGLLVFATEMQAEDLEVFRDVSVPLVAMDHNFPHMSVDTVAIDNRMGTWQAMEHLKRAGHTEVGYLCSSTRILSFEERRAGYREAAAALGLHLDPGHVFTLPYTEAGSYQAFREILRKKPDLPTAFVCDDDTIAVGCVRALLEAGIRVPEDVSVIGFNNRPSCAETEPPLTSIDVPKESFGGEAVDALLWRVLRRGPAGEETLCRKIWTGTRLVERDSVLRRTEETKEAEK